ncbi:MAG: DUF2480 family protein [Cyclobacteriaceae bacterium]
MEGEIINRVAESTLVTIDLEEYYPIGERVVIDLKDNLFQGLILREKDFREFAKDHDWQQYKDKFVGITCSADAIIPTWAYMLVTTKLEPFASAIFYGGLVELERHLMFKAIEGFNVKEYADKRIVIKGCGDLNIDAFAYVELTKKLTPHVTSIMYGEPCSTVPIYKRQKS